MWSPGALHIAIPGFHFTPSRLHSDHGPTPRAYTRRMQFEWDSAKATRNLRKHGVPFAEATSVFADPLAYTFADPDHSQYEHRWLTFGLSQEKRLLVVCHSERDDRIRIISARRVTRHERKIYEAS